MSPRECNCTIGVKLIRAEIHKVIIKEQYRVQACVTQKRRTHVRKFLAREEMRTECLGHAPAGSESKVALCTARELSQ